MSNDKHTVRSAQDVRQGVIVLRTRGRRIVFFTGLIAAILLVALLGLNAAWTG